MTWFLILLAATLLGIYFASLRQPDVFSYTHAATIAATPEAIFPHVDNLRAWNAWSPWARMDPNCKYTFTGPESGPGASIEWDGSRAIGAGRMTIVETTPPGVIKIRLEFFRPMKGVSDTLFTFTPDAGGTRVSWTMSGPNTSVGKIVGMLLNCEKLIGRQFTLGLANLKVVVENRA